MIQKEFDNYAAAAFGTDLLISALVFLCFSFFELKRLGLSRSRLFIYVAATFGIGLSCSLPLFLYFREGVLAGKNVGCVIAERNAPRIPKNNSPR